MKLNAKNEEFIPNSELPWYMSADPILTSCNENVHVKLLYILFHPYELRPAPSLKIPQLGNGPLTVAKATWIQLWNDWNILRFLVIPYPGICSADYLLPEFYDNKLLCFDTNESFFEIIFCDIQLLQQNKNKGGKGVTSAFINCRVAAYSILLRHFIESWCVFKDSTKTKSNKKSLAIIVVK